MVWYVRGNEDPEVDLWHTLVCCIKSCLLFYAVPSKKIKFHDEINV